MTAKAVLFKKRRSIAKRLILLSAPLLLIVAPVWKEGSAQHEFMEIFGHLLVMAGVLIRIYTSLYSGGRKNTTILEDGPYSVVRNPLYVGSFLAVLGIGMQTGSFSVAAAVTGIFLILHHFTIRKEEKFLSEHFGEKYESYYRSVPRWVPDFSLWKQPEEIPVMPRMVLLTMRDASAFIVALLIVELLCQLRTDGVIPAWLILT